MFSILILTKNEESQLASCIQSCSWSDDIVVLDSFSEDKTREIAEKNGAKFYQRVFDNFGEQRNYALDKIPFRYKWIFHLDADERFNDELKKECERVIQLDKHSGYFVPNRIIFLDRWIPHATQYPHPQVRLLKIGEVRFAKAGHGQREDQPLRGIGNIHIAYDHFNFSKGIKEWVQKHNDYSDEEAKEACLLIQGPIPISDLFGEKMVARRAMKRLHARLSGRWFFKFLYLYLFKKGFLDGYPGFAYCLLQTFYDFLISVKIKEFKNTK